MHEKVMIFDGAMADALAKLGDSLNISMNALEHNFENVGLWQGFHAAYMQAHFDYLWGLADEPSADYSPSCAPKRRKARLRRRRRLPLQSPSRRPSLNRSLSRRRRKLRVAANPEPPPTATAE